MSDTTASIIGGGIPIVGNAVNAVLQGVQNRKNRKFAREMYDKQKADTIDMWNMNNTYNSPQQQMRRLQEAGLNPNLAYGNGTNNVASAPDAPSGQSPSGQAPQINANSIIDGYFNFQMKQAQIDNMKMDNSLKVADLLIKNTIGEDRQYKLNANIRNDTYSADANRVINDSNNSLHRSQISQMEANIIENYGMQEAIEKIANLRARTATTVAQKEHIYQSLENLKKSGVIQDFEIQLNKNGFTRSDDVKIRFASNILSQFGIDTTSVTNKVKSFFKHKNK